MSPHPPTPPLALCFMCCRVGKNLDANLNHSSFCRTVSSRVLIVQKCWSESWFISVDGYREKWSRDEWSDGPVLVMLWPDALVIERSDGPVLVMLWPDALVIERSDGPVLVMLWPDALVKRGQMVLFWLCCGQMLWLREVRWSCSGYVVARCSGYREVSWSCSGYVVVKVFYCPGYVALGQMVLSWVCSGSTCPCSLHSDKSVLLSSLCSGQTVLSRLYCCSNCATILVMSWSNCSVYLVASGNVLFWIFRGHWTHVLA